MAMTTRVITPRVPEFDALDGTPIAVDYDALSDTLWVSLTGGSQPAISVYVDDDVIYRVDPVTEAVVGIEVENFLAGLLRRPQADGSMP